MSAVNQETLDAIGVIIGRWSNSTTLGSAIKDGTTGNRELDKTTAALGGIALIESVASAVGRSNMFVGPLISSATLIADTSKVLESIGQSNTIKANDLTQVLADASGLVGNLSMLVTALGASAAVISVGAATALTVVGAVAIIGGVCLTIAAMSISDDEIIDLNPLVDSMEKYAAIAGDTIFDAMHTALDWIKQKSSDAADKIEDWMQRIYSELNEIIPSFKIEGDSFLFPEIEAFAPNLVDEFRQGRSGAHTIQRYDPLSLDLDGDGLETTAAHTAGVLFDHDGDGIAHGSGWIAADDGLLVLDRNGNGRIDTGAELFGDHTDTRAGRALNGFAPLIELDDNGDGRVDAQDARFSALRVWRDLNQNGVSESNELFSLASLGIRALNIAHSAGNTVLANGNVIAETGTFTRTDGSSGTLADVNLLGDATRNRFSDNIPATETAGALPCIRQAQSRQRNPCRSRPTPWRAPRTARNSCFRRAYNCRARTWRSTAIPWRSRRA